MNVFSDDWEALGTGAEGSDWPGKVSQDLMLFQAFTDHKYTKDRKISSIHWHPTIHGKVQNHPQARELSKRIQKTLKLSTISIFFCQP